MYNDWAMGWMIKEVGFDSIGGTLAFLFCKPSQTSPEAHSPSYPLGKVDSFTTLKQLEQRADYSTPISASVMNAWGHVLTAAYAFMMWCLLMQRIIFTFTVVVADNMYIT